MKKHERALRIAYKDNVSSFENLLLMDNLVAVHQRNLQLLMIEIYVVVSFSSCPRVMEQLIFRNKRTQDYIYITIYKNTNCT